MSNEFCLPVRLSVSPRPLGAVIAAAYCLPLPLLLAAPAEWAAEWTRAGTCAALALAGISLAWELHRQRAAAAATEIEAAAGEDWLLHRRGGGYAPARLLGCADFGCFMLLLVGQNGKTFRLVARADAQQRGHWHRMRVLWKWGRRPRASAPD